MKKVSKVIAGVVAVAISAGTTASIAYAKNNKTEETPVSEIQKKPPVASAPRISEDEVLSKTKLFMCFVTAILL